MVDDFTVILFETSNQLVNRAIEKHIESQGVSVKGSARNRSFFTVRVPCKSYKLKLKNEKWYSFDLRFFSNVEKLTFLSSEDIGSNIIRANIILKKYKNKFIPKNTIKKFRLSNIKEMNPDHLFKLLNKKHSEIDIIYLINIIKLTNKKIFSSNKLKEKILSFKTINEIVDFINSEECKSDEQFSELLAKSLYQEKLLIDLFKEIKHRPIKMGIKTFIEETNDIKSNADNNIAIKIINCGNGNWNEIHTNNAIYFYDLGAGTHLTEEQITSFAQPRISNLVKTHQDKALIFIISHWDKDHYQSILTLEPDTFKKITYFFAPIPNYIKSNQDTVKRTISHITETLGSNRIHFFTPPKRKNKEVGVENDSFLLSPHISLHLGEESSDSNKSGILISINGLNNSAILSSDHHWNQVSKITNKVKNSSLIIVTPHHGGVAGSFRKYLESKPLENIKIKLCTSCNEYNNSYKHPRREYIHYLENNNLNHKRTDIDTSGYGKYITYRIN